MARLITLRIIQSEVIARSRSWILGEMAAGRFPRPAVEGVPNLWDADDVNRWLVDFVAKAKLAKAESKDVRRARYASSMKRAQLQGA